LQSALTWPPRNSPVFGDTCGKSGHRHRETERAAQHTRS